MKMQYKGFVWPNNPETYSLRCEHLTAVHKLPFGSFFVQDLGKTATILRGEGAFFGPEAYRNFQKLEQIFSESGSGVLLHPVWSGHRVFFTKLTLMQEPRKDYAAYQFEFCEEGLCEQALSQAGDYHTVSAGETAWAICARYGLSMERFLRLNPQIIRPNFLSAGEEVRVQ